jgi:hypothetical protein
MSLLDMVQQHLGPSEVNQISQQLGVDQATAQRAVGAAVPMMVGGMAQHADQPDGEAAIAQAAQSHAGALGNISGMLGAGGPADGGGLLGRVMGQHQATVQQGVQQASGLDQDKTKKLLLMLSPIVLSVLAHRQAGQQQQQGGAPADGGGGLGGILRQATQAAGQQGQGGGLGGLGGMLGGMLGGR